MRKDASRQRHGTEILIQDRTEGNTGANKAYIRADGRGFQPGLEIAFNEGFWGSR